MKILVVNDDGIKSEGLRILASWAKQYGDVTVCAPKIEQSAKSHSIQIHQSFEVTPYDFGDPDIEAYSVDSTPADCVRFGVIQLSRQYNLVLSGINKGLNLGEDIGYSATVGAVMEAGYHHIPAIAFSTDPASFKEAEKQLDKCYDFIKFNGLFDIASLFNVNIPLNSKEILITHQGEAYFRDTYTEVSKNMFKPNGYSIYKGSLDFDTDRDAALNGYITVSPLTVSTTDMEAYRIMKNMKLKQTF